MGRKRKGARVRGPYRDRGRWRVVLINEDGTRVSRNYAREDQAKRVVKEARQKLSGEVIMSEALAQYERELTRRGNRPASVTTSMIRLRNMHDQDQPISHFTRAKCQESYDRRCDQVAVDTHRMELTEARTFWRWVVARRWAHRSPVEGIKPMGRRRRGKTQLRVSEARLLYQVALERAGKGGHGALGVLMALLLGLRSSEVRRRRVRDVDVSPGSTLLWIDRGKTRSSTRHFDLGEPLAGLLRRHVAGRAPGDWLFPAPNRQVGYHDRSWLLDACTALCKLAGIQRVTPHGLRGTWATLAREAGTSGQVVSRELGHADEKVTREHYEAPGTDERARAKATMRVIDGGRKDGS